MRSPVAFVIAGAIFWLAACQAPSFDPEDPAIVAEIESRFQSAMEGAARVDVDQVLEGAAGAGELTFITGDVMLSGLDRIRVRFEETYSGLASQELTFFEKRVRILGPDAALVMAVGEGTFTDQAGWTSEPVGIAVTVVFARENGTWRVRHAHQSITD